MFIYIENYLSTGLTILSLSVLQWKVKKYWKVFFANHSTIHAHTRKQQERRHLTFPFWIILLCDYIRNILEQHQCIDYRTRTQLWSSPGPSSWLDKRRELFLPPTELFYIFTALNYRAGQWALATIVTAIWRGFNCHSIAK